jgi:glyoxylase-like metal-dependent hydrolase (beta-lactamase superfamily II)
MQFGNFQIHLISDGHFKLDGGAMFGVVPKALWQKTNPADESNRIQLGLNCLLIQTDSDLILVDTGIGSLYDEKFARIYGVDKSTDLLSGLAQLGHQPQDVSKVILTHLHFDHCGGNCCLDANSGQLTAAFPNAVYYFNRKEFEYAVDPDPRSKASYLPHNWQSLQSADQIAWLEGDSEVVSGIQTIVTGGHTGNHQIVRVTSAGETACFLADLVPTESHLKIPYVMGYDLFPCTTMQMKQKVLEQAVDEQWLLLFEHTPDQCAGYLSVQDGKYSLKRENL